ncbi:MAG TPA: PDDEXK nuclease domain-containing protein [Gemmataceae bacterium]|nr:PDDEXK nuclease domain-containing protein [Gemmataceae bacterium]
MAKRKKPGKQIVPATRTTTRTLTTRPLLQDVRNLIRQAREATSQAVNAALVLLYWQIGQRIRTEILKEQRAGYGEEIYSTLSNKLTAEFGDGFSQPNLSRMTRFAEVFPDPAIISTLSNKLSWSHFVEIIPLRDDLQRDFYAELCRIERWSVRTLRAKVQSMLFERTALSRKPTELARQELDALREDDKITPDLVFRDPYILNFLGLSDSYKEKDLETAILNELQSFILELGAGFAFIDRQKRIVIDGKDFYLDLLFFHRGLRRLLAIDLKIGGFEAADKGQMELYLRWLERHEMQPGEDPPLGLILCADKGEEQVELLQLNRSGIRVASYLTELPPRPLLQKKLHDTLVLARARLDARPAKRVKRT